MQHSRSPETASKCPQLLPRRWRRSGWHQACPFRILHGHVCSRAQRSRSPRGTRAPLPCSHHCIVFLRSKPHPLRASALWGVRDSCNARLPEVADWRAWLCRCPCQQGAQRPLCLVAAGWDWLVAHVPRLWLGSGWAGYLNPSIQPSTQFLSPWLG